MLNTWDEYQACIWYKMYRWEMHVPLRDVQTVFSPCFHTISIYIAPEVCVHHLVSESRGNENERKIPEAQNPCRKSPFFTGSSFWTEWRVGAIFFETIDIFGFPRPCRTHIHPEKWVLRGLRGIISPPGPRKKSRNGHRYFRYAFEMRSPYPAEWM